MNKYMKGGIGAKKLFGPLTGVSSVGITYFK